MISFNPYRWKPREKVCPSCSTRWVDPLLDFDQECPPCRERQSLIQEGFHNQALIEAERRQFAEQRSAELQHELRGRQNHPPSVYVMHTPEDVKRYFERIWKSHR